MSRVSTFAGSSFSPDRMFRSNTAPVSKFLNLVRVKAAPLPGLTNWNSITVNGLPSIKTLRPLRISDVSYISGDVYPAPPLGVKPRAVVDNSLWTPPRTTASCCSLAGTSSWPRRPLRRSCGTGRWTPMIAMGTQTLTIEEDYPEEPDHTLPYGKEMPSETDLEVFPLAKKAGASFQDRITIGRTSNNDVVLNDTSVSRLHAYIRRDGQGWIVADAGSKNGSWLRGAQLDARREIALPSRAVDQARRGRADVLHGRRSVRGARRLMSEVEWDQRVLCPDGACTGSSVPTAPARCVVTSCRTGVTSACAACSRIPTRTSMRARSPATTTSTTRRTRPTTRMATRMATSGEDEGEDEPRAGEWTERKLCDDGACVGVIGDDGTCTVCGKRSAA